MNETASAETRKLRIEEWDLVRDDDSTARERWLVVDDDGQVCARIEFERHRAFAYTGDKGDAVMDMAVRTVRRAQSRPDGFGLADDTSRKAVLEHMMLLLPAYLRK